MLQSLYIKDFILIDELNIDFRNGFSAFTGETGAGKSIFIDSIAILAGDRLTASQIRKGAPRAVIEGVFNVGDKLRTKLEEAGYDSDVFIVSREINTEGKTVCRINQRTSTVGFVRECLEDVIDIHCQHDNQYLLNEKYHLSLLDTFCNQPDKLDELKKLYSAYRSIEKEYRELSTTKFSEAQLEMLKYQINEIESMNLKPDEEEEIQKTLDNFNAIEKIQKTTEDLRNMFSDDEGILTRLYNFTKISSDLNSVESLKTNVENIINAYYAISDDYDAIISVLDNSTMDISSIDDLNQRLFDIQRIKRKYSASVPELLNMLEDLKKQVDMFDNAEFILEKLKKESQQAYAVYLEKAREVSAVRKEKAVEMESLILGQLKDLNLEKARFKVEFRETEGSSSGIDDVRFLISMNTGMDLAPLNKVASGGELSRLMLGLKTVFTSLQGSELVIFDEIDAGVSGVVAFNIGVKMAQIARSIQVFAVTHLAPVASCARQHYRIRKFEEDNTTKTVVEMLNENERVEELSVLSTSTLTQTSLSAAKELLEKGQQYA